MSRHVAARLLPPTAAYMSRDPEGEWNEEADSLGGTHRRRTRSARHRANRGCAWPEARGRGVVVPPRKRRPARHQPRLRQCPLLEGQPERALRSGADAAPAQLPEAVRHGFLELAYAADRAHRQRQPRDLLGALRRPARSAPDQLVQGLQPRRVDGSRDLLHLLDVADHRHEDQSAGAEPGRYDAVDGLCRRRRHTCALGAVHTRGLHGRQLLDRQHGARERGRRRPHRVRRELAGGAADRE